MDNQKQIAEKLKQANNVLVTVSSNPTVDQLAACIGLSLALNKLDKHAAAVYSGRTPSTIEFLNPGDTLEKNTDSLRDFIISLDKSKADKLRYKVEDEVVRIFITPYRTSIDQDDLEFSQGDFNVDVVVALGVHEQQDLDQAITIHGRILHDATVVTMNTSEAAELGAINWLDEQASSLSEMATAVVNALDKEILDEQIATALLTGIVAETDRFSNEKTTANTMKLSATLMAAGANQQLVATKLEEPTELPEDRSDSQDSDDAGGEEEIPQAAVSDDGTLRISHDDEDDEPKEQKKPEKEKVIQPHPEEAKPADDGPNLRLPAVEETIEPSQDAQEVSDVAQALLPPLPPADEPPKIRKEKREMLPTPEPTPDVAVGIPMQEPGDVPAMGAQHFAAQDRILNRSNPGNVSHEEPEEEKASPKAKELATDEPRGNDEPPESLPQPEPEKDDELLGALKVDQTPKEEKKIEPEPEKSNETLADLERKLGVVHTPPKQIQQREHEELDLTTLQNPDGSGRPAAQIVTEESNEDAVSAARNAVAQAVGHDTLTPPAAFNAMPLGSPLHENEQPAPVQPATEVPPTPPPASTQPYMAQPSLSAPPLEQVSPSQPPAPAPAPQTAPQSVSMPMPPAPGAFSQTPQTPQAPSTAPPVPPPIVPGLGQ